MSVDSPSPRLGLSGSDADVAASTEGSNWYGLMFLSLGLKASDNWLASSPEISTLKPSKVLVESVRVVYIGLVPSLS